MIARPLNRPHPIPFGAAPAAASSPRAPVSWAESSGPAVLAEGRQILPRLSPVKVGGGPALVPHPAREQPGPASRPGNAAAPLAQGRVQDVPATFLGQGALSVRSSVTGRHYRFQGHGDRLLVDPRDQLMLTRVADIRIG